MCLHDTSNGECLFTLVTEKKLDKISYHITLGRSSVIYFVCLQGSSPRKCLVLHLNSIFIKGPEITGYKWIRNSNGTIGISKAVVGKSESEFFFVAQKIGLAKSRKLQSNSLDPWIYYKIRKQLFVSSCITCCKPNWCYHLPLYQTLCLDSDDLMNYEMAEWYIASIGKI